MKGGAYRSAALDLRAELTQVSLVTPSFLIIMEEANCCHCFKSTAKTRYTNCFSCKLRLHFNCINISEIDFDSLVQKGSRNLKIVCNRCDITLSSFAQMQESIESVKSTLNDRLARIEELLAQTQINNTTKEEIISEAIERSMRAANVILTNVPENQNNNDCDVANDILEVIDNSAVVIPENVTRLGKSTNGRPRLLRLKFNNTEMAKLVLKKEILSKRILHSTKLVLGMIKPKTSNCS